MSSSLFSQSQFTNTDLCSLNISSQFSSKTPCSLCYSVFSCVLSVLNALSEVLPLTDNQLITAWTRRVKNLLLVACVGDFCCLTRRGILSSHWPMPVMQKYRLTLSTGFKTLKIHPQSLLIANPFLGHILQIFIKRTFLSRWSQMMVNVLQGYWRQRLLMAHGIKRTKQR